MYRVLKKGTERLNHKNRLAMVIPRQTEAIALRVLVGLVTGFRAADCRILNGKSLNSGLESIIATRGRREVVAGRKSNKHFPAVLRMLCCRRLPYDCLASQSWGSRRSLPRQLTRSFLGCSLTTPGRLREGTLQMENTGPASFDQARVLSRNIQALNRAPVTTRSVAKMRPTPFSANLSGSFLGKPTNGIDETRHLRSSLSGNFLTKIGPMPYLACLEARRCARQQRMTTMARVRP